MQNHKLDPYRAVRKQPSPDVYSPSPKYESDQAESRSLSESSTTQLAMNTPYMKNTPHNQDQFVGQYDYYNKDQFNAPQPFDKRNPPKKKRPQEDPYGHETNTRANAYTPYTAPPAPYEPNNPAYLQDNDDYLPNFNSPGQKGNNGSILHDNMAMDMMDHDRPYEHTDTKHIESQPLPVEKRPWWLRLGISGKKLLFGVFGFIAVVAIIWFFVWPRVPTLEFVSAALREGETYVTEESMDVAWTVNFTVKNENNWIPTSIKNFEVNLLNANTHIAFGHGNSGRLTLKPRSIGQVISVPIYINYISKGVNDQTWKDLYNSCVRHKFDLEPPVTQQSLNIQFQVVYYIAGLSWTYVSNFTPASGYFQCPLPP